MSKSKGNFITIIMISSKDIDFKKCSNYIICQGSIYCKLSHLNYLCPQNFLCEICIDKCVGIYKFVIAECPICTENKKSIVYTNCTHNTCIDCYKKCIHQMKNIYNVILYVENSLHEKIDSSLYSFL